ncbi:MAG: prephenate dehydrogenase/arogenate dehydrogenase family protein [Candidatus Gastranaerophilales bacterium]
MMVKIGVVGLGLIGGSIFKSLNELGENVIGVSNSQTGDGIFSSYDELKSCDVVFVCSAMNKTLEILDELENVLSPETVVTDVCSLKEFVCKRARTYKFIPSHPMAGTEHSGFDNSFAGLFDGAKWVLTPEFGEDGIEILQDLIEKMGAEAVLTDAKSHDEAVAMISHMPMVIAQGLMLASKNNPLALEIASSGFRDMTRLALSNEEMACDMVSMNAGNIENSILGLYKSMGELMKGDYPEIIADLKNIRKNMF